MDSACAQQADADASEAARADASACIETWLPRVQRHVRLDPLSCLPCGSYFFLEVLAEGRKRLGFNQEWMPDSDFKLLGSRDLGFCCIFFLVILNPCGSPKRTLRFLRPRIYNSEDEEAGPLKVRRLAAKMIRTGAACKTGVTT